MRKLVSLPCHCLLLSLVGLSLCVTTFIWSAAAQEQPKQSGQRRPLPKPPTGSRGFEQAPPVASARLIAAGAVRGPLKPIAPLEGLAYDQRPFFAWTAAPDAGSYHFMLRDGPDSDAAIVFETDAKVAQLSYPAEAPALSPGKLYSWRVSMPGVMERRIGPAARFFILAGDDAAQVRTALAKAKLQAPKSAAERLAQARIFEQYGVWYDALRVASELLAADPNNREAKAFYDSLINRLKDEAAKAAAQSVTSELRLWRELEPLVAGGNETAALAASNRDINSATALYRELLFDAVDARLYNNSPLNANSDRVRTLLAQVNNENAALEAKLTSWSREHKPGEAFQKSATGMELLLYLYIAGAPANIANQKVPDGEKAATSRELMETALQTAEEVGSELAVASCAANLASYAIQERRVAEAREPLQQAGEIWKDWQHPVGLAQAAYLGGEIHALEENWRDAATDYQQAAHLAAVLPTLRPLRVSALGSLAWSLRNLDDKEGVLAALLAEVAEQEQIVQATAGSEKHTQQAKKLSDMEIELGAALAALNRYAEAGERYAVADRLRDENYAVERVRLEKIISEWEAKLKAAKLDQTLDESKRKIEIMRAGIILDANLSFLSARAGERDDWATLAAVAERRVAAARESGDQEKLADALDAAAKSYHAAGNLPRARLYAKAALDIRSVDPRRKYLYSSVEISADLAYDADQTDEAETRYREVLELTKVGALPPPYDLSAEPDEAIRNIRAQMNAGERTSRQMSAFQAHLRTATILEHKGNFSAAEQQHNAAATDILQLYAAGAPDETELASWLGELEKSNKPLTERIKTIDIIAHRRQTGFTTSQEELERLQQVDLIAAGLRATLALSRAGLLDDQGDLRAAVRAYKDAITQTTNVLGGAFSMSASYLVLARIERELGNYSAAEAPLASALAEYQRKHDAWGLTGVLSQQSELRRQQGRLDEAYRLATDALKISQTLNSRPATAGVLRTLGRVESDLGGESLKASEVHLRESLGIWREYGLRGHTAYTLSFLGLTQERLNHDDDALASYEEAVKLVESLTASLSQNVSADTFNSTRVNRDLYDRLIKLLIRRGRFADALQYLERAKSKSLVDALAGANINAKDPALKELIDRVRLLGDSVRVAETTLVTEMQKPAEQRDAGIVAAARARVESAQQQYRAAVAQIQQANPSYANLVAVNPTDLAEVRRHLPPKTLLLEYFPTNTELYIFVVTRDNGPTIRTVAIGREDLAKLVMQYREALNSAGEPSVLERSASGSLWRDDGREDFKRDILPIKEATSKLYNLLIAPAQAEVDQADTLVIVPAAELYYLPIHALGQLNQEGAFSFLIEQKAFAYLASADLLNAVNSATVANHSARVSPARTMLALGNPDGSLPGANMEVSELGRIFAGANIFTGKEATIAHVAQSTASSSYIHFATHGFINSLEPKETYLLLAGEPGRLSVKDIVEDNYKLSFEGTRLVTLSACETNIGGYDPSAVYSSLSRAFSKAGAPTVVASLWSVNDASTRETMTTFYKEMAAGQSKAEALRRAQLATMHDPRFAHPYYWAPFVVLGDWR